MKAETIRKSNESKLKNGYGSKLKNEIKMKNESKTDYDSDVEYEGKIDSYGYDGEGVLRLDGKVVFVPYALKDEVIKFKIVSSHSTFLNGNLTEVLHSSPQRAAAPCKYFGRCGGCSYQHTTYENELEIKKDLLAQQLKKVNFQVEARVVKSPNEYGYRNKIRMFVDRDGLSLIERGSHKLCKVDGCLLVDEKINRAIEIIDRFISAQKLTYSFSEIVIREENDNLAVIFYKKPGGREINYQGVYLMLGDFTGIYEYENHTLTHKMGNKYLQSNEHGLNCKFKPNSFHQVNKFLVSGLYQYVVDNIVGDLVVNCYSGSGVLSGFIANQNKRVIGIELGESEHQDAELLKEENALYTSLTNIHGDCAKVLPNITDADTIIVDPPRSGMEKSVVETLNLKNCQRLIYVSCNSATFVRDVDRLSGYRLSSVTLFDMFARTGEYEVVGILDKF